jgi:hypothetical protein
MFGPRRRIREGKAERFAGKIASPNADKRNWDDLDASMKSSIGGMAR